MMTGEGIHSKRTIPPNTHDIHLPVLNSSPSRQTLLGAMAKKSPAMGSTEVRTQNRNRYKEEVDRTLGSRGHHGSLTLAAPVTGQLCSRYHLLPGAACRLLLEPFFRGHRGLSGTELDS